MKFDTLIIEGGGFKTAFTAGLVDAFIAKDYNPFKTIIGISGGSVAMSYYLSNQYRFCINAMKILAKDNKFADFKRTFSAKGYLDIDYISTVASEKVPFDVMKAAEQLKRKQIFIVATNRKTGKAEYLNPCSDDWIQCVIASSTLPFATKGVHKLKNKLYFDGGWSDPLPVKWAISQGSKNILVLRTRPINSTIKQSWADYFGSKYFKSTPKLSKTFEKAFEKYNEAIQFMEKPPKGIKIEQIGPKRFLNSGTYSYSKKSLMSDYRYGLDKGINFLSTI